MVGLLEQRLQAVARRGPPSGSPLGALLPVVVGLDGRTHPDQAQRALRRVGQELRAPSAARPEVAGTAKEVATSTAVTRCISWRGDPAPATRNVTARAGNPAASTNAAIRSQMMSEPRVANSRSASMTPARVSRAAAPSAM